MANIKTQFITTLSDLKTLATALGGWFTADKTTDVNFNGTVVPSRAKEIEIIKNIVPTDKDYLKKDLSNITNMDFKAKALASGLQQTLPLKIFTQTSGKFFVANIDGSLPSGIDTNKVWSLTDQATSNGGTVPSGKTHIELPLALNRFTGAGAGGGGGGISDNTDGTKGGDTTIYSPTPIIAYGGFGGRTGNVSSGTSGYNVHGTGSNGMIYKGDGAKGGNGEHVYTVYDRVGWTGGNGGKVVQMLGFAHAGSIDFMIGAGGVGGGTGYIGENGYIEVEYV